MTDPADLADHFTRLADGHETFASAESDPVARAYLWGLIRGYRNAALAVSTASQS